jgi:hypothetical protein
MRVLALAFLLAVTAVMAVPVEKLEDKPSAVRNLDLDYFSKSSFLNAQLSSLRMSRLIEFLFIFHTHTHTQQEQPMPAPQPALHAQGSLSITT